MADSRTVLPKSVVKPYPDDADQLKAHEFHLTLSDGLVYSCGGFVPRATPGGPRQVILIRTPNGLEDGPFLTEAIAEEFKALGAAVPEVVDPVEELTTVSVAKVDDAKALLDRLKQGDSVHPDEITAILSALTGEPVVRDPVPVDPVDPGTPVAPVPSEDPGVQ